MNGRIPLIAGNWKMHKTVAESVDTAVSLKELIEGTQGVEVMLAPVFTAITALVEALEGSSIAVGAQNLFWEKQGAYTGEVSPEMLREAGCSQVIVGHSERRQYFGETDENVNKKLRAAFRVGLQPILCVGETEAERDQNQTFSVLDKQVETGLKGFFSEDLYDLIIAYEPVWAIGTGKTATRQQAQEVHHYLRQKMADMFDSRLAEGIRILYGGSVKPDNIAELMAMADIDGALVGGASLEAETFAKLVKYRQ